MTTAICRECSVEKPLTEFHKKIAAGPLEAWNVRRCKDCGYRQYKKRYADPAKRETQKVASSRWKKKNPERHAETAKGYRARNKHKTMAQNRLNYAVSKGEIQRGPCETCGTTDRVHGHHKTYEPKDWLNVRWLCYRCHKSEHTGGN